MSQERWGDRVATMATCALCHRQGFDVAAGMARLPDQSTTTGYRIEPMTRCRDAAACRQRLELRHQPWPLFEEAPSPTLPGFTEAV